MHSQATILSVGEYTESSRTVSDILSRAGYRVQSVASCELAAAVTAALPDLIIAEMKIPGVRKLCDSIRFESQGREIPRVLIVGSTDVMERAEGLHAGACDILPSPFHPDELLVRVETQLELRRLRAENDQLRAQDRESVFRDIVNGTPVMMFTAGPDRQGTFFNERWLEFRGRTMDLELGWGWTDGVHPDDRESCLASYSRAFEARADWRLEYRLRRADDEYRWILCDGVPRYGAGGGFAGYIACCVDITDIRRNEQGRLKPPESERLMLFAAGVAHDFNNLLAAAYAELALALPSLRFNTPARKRLHNIQDILAQASGVVALLISYSATGNPPPFEAVDISAVVEDVIRIMQDVFSPNPVRLIGNLHPHLPRILANETQIRRMVMNLITNAVEAVDPKGGSIRISTSLAHIGSGQSAPEPDSLKEGDYVSLSIADTGHGMRAETLARAMDPFFTTKPQGRGLGLAVVQGIVRSHGGAIHVSSSSGGGATFEVLLPTAPGPAYRPHQQAANNMAGHNLSVLFTEDEAILRSATGAALKQKGFRVSYAADGNEAVKKLLNLAEDIDVVVLDLTLPGLSGLDVLAKIPKLRPGAAIVLTSGHYVEARSLDALAGGARYAVIRKPYRLPELVEAILAQVNSVSTTGVPGGDSHH